MNECLMVKDSMLPEVCILTVVASGLCILSLFKIGTEGAVAPFTVWTVLLFIIALFSLICGAILYALCSAHIDRFGGGIAGMLLAAALISSLFIAIERAVLEA